MCGWLISTIRPFAICLRRSMQKFGAVSGLGLLASVRYKNGREALADMARRYWPFDPFKVKSSSSVSGCAILLILAFRIVLFNSYTKLDMTNPSKAMMFVLLHK